MKLEIKDFEKVELGVGLPPYFHRILDKGGREICLEPCLRGFCVGMYDEENDLIGGKRCTNIPSDPKSLNFGEEVSPEALPKAVDIANEMLHECLYCDGRGEFTIDGHDHRGEHVQTIDKCYKCNGTGRVE